MGCRPVRGGEACVGSTWGTAGDEDDAERDGVGSVDGMATCGAGGPDAEAGAEATAEAEGEGDA